MIYLTPGFRKKLADDERDYLAYADITLSNGQTLNLTNTEIWQDGFSVDDAVSDDNTFGALGATIIGAGTLIIDNTHGEFTQYDFLNADVVMSIALMIDDTTPARKEPVKMGTFRVDDARYDEATITLSLLDFMEQFDRPYALVGITYPATLMDIVRNACTRCGVQLASLSFPRDDYEVASPPEEDCTYREVIGWVATLAGCFARCNRDGELEIKWFNTSALEDNSGTDGGIFDTGTPYYQTGDNVNGGSFNPWNDGDAVEGGQVTDPIPVHYVNGLYSQEICVDETVITGVRIIVEDPDSSAEEQEHSYTSGASGYEVQIENNPFITMETAQAHANWLGNRLIGLHFRKCTVQQTDDPAIEAGDVGLLFDAKSNEYPILITRVAFEIGGPQTIVCASDTPAHNSSTRYTAATKSYSEMRKRLKDQINSFDVAMNSLRNDIANAKGLYADEIEDPDNPGSTIYVLHDKPLLAQSPVRIMVSSVGVTVTANGTAAEPNWYGLRVNGDMIARIMNTIGINFDWGTGGTLKLGGENNTNGVLSVYDASNNIIGRWTKDGIVINKGTIRGPSIIAGGANNANGTITTYDSSGQIRMVINKSGLKLLSSVMLGGILVLRGNYTDSTRGESALYIKYSDLSGANGGKLELLLGGKSTDYQDYDTFQGKYDNNTIKKISSYSLGGERGNSYCTVIELQRAGALYGFAIASPNYNSRYNSTGEKLYGLRYYERSSDHLPIFNIRGAIVIEPWTNEKAGIFWHSGTSEANPVEWEPDSTYRPKRGIVPKKGQPYDWNSCDTNIIGNLFINGNAVSSSSSRKYKEDIDDLCLEELDPHKLLNLPVRQGRYKAEYNEYKLQYLDMAGKTLPMFIAEEVDEIYPAATIHDNETGEIESWDERRIIPGMLALIQEQDKNLKKQEEEIEDLKKQLEEVKKIANEAYKLALAFL